MLVLVRVMTGFMLVLVRVMIAFSVHRCVVDYSIIYFIKRMRPFQTTLIMFDVG